MADYGYSPTWNSDIRKSQQEWLEQNPPCQFCNNRGGRHLLLCPATHLADDWRQKVYSQFCTMQGNVQVYPTGEWVQGHQFCRNFDCECRCHKTS